MLLHRKILTTLTAVVAALGGFSSQAIAGSTTGNAQAVIVNPITIAESQAMNFGSIGPAAAASTVVLSTAGAVSSAAADLVPGTGAAAGVFSVSGEAGYTYAITLPVSATLTSGANTMTVDTWTTATGSGTATLDGTGADTVNVGATLNVGAGQAAGTYTGTYTITVDYN
ncbi:MAG: DUF4402 domain-containing protein [Gammaproteobacteria bacterium]|jgi:hypothetical protein